MYFLLPGWITYLVFKTWFFRVSAKARSAQNKVVDLMCQEMENLHRAHPRSGLGWCRPALARFSGELGWAGVTVGELGWDWVSLTVAPHSGMMKAGSTFLEKKKKIWHIPYQVWVSSLLLLFCIDAFLNWNTLHLAQRLYHTIRNLTSHLMLCKGNSRWFCN